MGLLTRHPKDRTTTYPGDTTHPGFWTSSRKWGILRVITIIALGVLLVGINSAVDKWKRDETGGRDGNMQDGVVQYNLPHTSFRDYSHRGLQHATNYFMNHRNGAEVLGRTRDAVLCLQGLFVLILIYRHHAFGCRFIIEFFIYIVLREFATIMFWEPIPEDAVYPAPSKIDADTDHFFSGHVCTSLLLTIELIRASHPYRLPIRFGIAFIMYTISLFVTIVQLILRVHYFADIYCAFFVAHLICATYHLLELHHHIPRALMDETGDGHLAGPNTKGSRRSSASDTDGHMQQTNAQPVNEYGHTFPASQSYRPTMQYGVEPHERAMDNVV